MEKVVVSLGGSVLVPGDDDGRYLRDLAALLREVSGRVKLFVVTGGGRMTFRDLIDLAGTGHEAAGPSIVFDPVAARVVARDRTPLSVVHGRDPDALRSAILGEPFRGTLVVD